MTVLQNREVILIAARSCNNVIGAQGFIPWSVRSEQLFFRSITLGQAVVMGRKTYASLPQPLGQRTNIVLSRQPDLRLPGCTVCTSLEEIPLHCRSEQKIFIIGGEEIYRQTLPLADHLILTTLHIQVPGDTFFPDFSSYRFQLAGQITVAGSPDYTICQYVRST